MFFPAQVTMKIRQVNKFKNVELFYSSMPTLTVYISRPYWDVLEWLAKREKTTPNKIIRNIVEGYIYVQYKVRK